MSGSQGARVVAIIPARYGSQRLPAKPLADICGKPMIQHVYERTKAARRVDSVIVATDDERIVSAVHAFGGAAIMTPATLQSGTDRIAYVARSIPEAEIIVNVQGDEPLMTPGMVDEAILPLVGNKEIVVGTLVKRIETEAELKNPNIVKVVLDNDGFCLYFSRSVIPFGRDIAESAWLRNHLYFKHLGIYVFRREFLLQFSEMKPTPLEQCEKLEQLRILENGYRIKARVTELDSTPVDTEADLEKVRTTIQMGL
jgi:3-deoxy-manno-octulosonate cytidylyltransferase (CMP-KDO synthetase)